MRKFIYILFSSFLFISCNDDNKKEIDNYTQIQKEWVGQGGSIFQLKKSETKYVDFKNGGGLAVKKEIRNTFTASKGIFEPTEVKGEWELKSGDNNVSDSIILTYTADARVGIDSISVESNSGKENVILQDNSGRKHKITPQDIDLSLNKIIKTYAITDLSVEEFVLQNNNEKLNFAHAPPALETTFSLKSLWRGFLGILVLIAIAFLFSNNRRKISWRTVGIGLLLQILLAIGILKVGFVQSFFEQIGSFFVVILDFTKEGSTFLFGGFMDVDTMGFIFAFQVLPTIIFFAALTSLLFYLGIIQKIVYGLAWVMTKLLGISGPESLSVAGNIFLGQTESPLMIKAYLEKMTRSEIMLVMTGGMATLAGGVLAAYIAFLGGDDPVQRLYFAKHLLAASFMAAPGAIIISKILVPETEKISTDVDVPKEKIGSNVLDAISNGTTEGLKLAANVAAMLLVFVALIAMANHILGWLGDITTLNNLVAGWTDGQYTSLSLEMLLGYFFAPLMWIIGVATEDITLVGRLLGEKIIMTEFIGYVSLADLKSAGAFASTKSILIATYMLCGFANFASIGIQIGGIGVLAPGKRKLLSEFGIRALLAGTLASLLSATLVGMILG